MNDLTNCYVNQIDQKTSNNELGKNSLQEQKNILLSLVKDLDQKLELLLTKLNGQNEEITNLKYENEKLKNNYKQILEQINLYITELESIKNS
ncbi:MAG: hypothetical protein RCG15_04260 [Candidatus Rickettsia vulgarisii]